MLTFLCSALFVLFTSPEDVEHMFLQRSSFKRASRSLAKTGYIKGPRDTFIQVDMILNYMFRLGLRGTCSCRSMINPGVGAA